MKVMTKKGRRRMWLATVVVVPIALLLTACPNPSAPAKVTMLASGAHHALALKSDGTVWSWGYNVSGALGDGSTTDRTLPVEVVGPGGSGAFSGATSIAAGTNFSLALKSDGSVWAWGNNDGGELGDGTSTQRHTPTEVVGPGGTGTLTGVTAVAAGYHHALALKSDGTVWAWGENGFGQLGDGTTTERMTPVQVVQLQGVIAIAAGSDHSLALTSDGSVWAWGANASGQLGDGATADRSAPVRVSGLSGVTAIAAGAAHSLALRSDGTVWAWGSNGFGQLGDGTTTDRHAPVRVAGLKDSIGIIAAGGDHSFAIDRSVQTNELWAWGLNNEGQLGDGSTTDRHTPVARQFLGAGDVEAAKIAVAAGGEFSLALENDGTVWSWGYNGDGELGDDSTANRDAPGMAG